MNWINTSERLPSPGESVLIYAPNCALLSGIGVAAYGHKSWWVEQSGLSLPGDHASHWMPLPAPPRKVPMGKCYDCDRPYSDEHGFPDLIVPHHIWRRISPTGDRGGALCPSCICKRLYWLGVRDVPAAFTSGPIRSIDPELMTCICRLENLTELKEMRDKETQTC